MNKRPVVYPHQLTSRLLLALLLRLRCNLLALSRPLRPCLLLFRHFHWTLRANGIRFPRERGALLCFSFGSGNFARLRRGRLSVCVGRGVI